MKKPKPIPKRLAAWILSIAMVLTMLPAMSLTVLAEETPAETETEQPALTDPTEEPTPQEETEQPTEETTPQEETEQPTGEPEAAAPARRSAAKTAHDYVYIELNDTKLQLFSGQGIASNSATEITQSSGGVAYYNDGTLTLNGLQADYIECYRGLTIQVNGANTLNGWVEAGSYNRHCGIYVYGDLTITGSGTLEVSTASYSGDRSPYGIYCDRSLTLNGAKVTVSGANGSYGICAKEGITVNGGTLDITATDTGMYCNYGGITIIGGAKVNIGGTPTNGIQVNGSDNLLGITGAGTEVNIPAVTGYAVINASTRTTGAADIYATNIFIEDHAKLTIGSCNIGLCSSWLGVLIKNSPVTVANAAAFGIQLDNDQMDAPGILEITGNSVVNLTGGSCAVKVDSDMVSKIDLTPGGSVTVKKTRTGDGKTNYAMDSWVELGNNTAVSGGTVYNTTHSANPKARDIEGNDLTFRYNAAPLQIEYLDQKTYEKISIGDLTFEQMKEVDLRLSVSSDGFSGYTSNVLWTITGLPDGLRATVDDTTGYAYIKGKPSSAAVGKDYTVIITAEAYGKSAVDRCTRTVKAAMLTGTLIVGSESYDINNDYNHLVSKGWSWSHDDQVLTLGKDVYLGMNISLTDAKRNGEPIPLIIRVNGSNTLYPSNCSSAINSDYGVYITGEPGSNLSIVIGDGLSYGISCGNNESVGNEITISKDVTVEFSIKNTSSPVTAIYTDNGDVTLLGSVTVTQWSPGIVDNKAVTGIEVGKTHCVNIGNGSSSSASLTVDLPLNAKETTAITAGGVIVYTAPDHTAITTDYLDAESLNTFQSIKLIPEGFPEGETCGLYVISGKLDMRGVNFTVVSGRGPVFLGSGADVKIMGYGYSNAGIYLTGEGSDMTIAPGGKLNMDFVSDGIHIDGKLQVNDKDCPTLTTLKVEGASVAVAAKKGVEIYGNSQVDLTTSNTAVVYTINNNGDNGNSTVDLSTGGYVKLTSEQGAVATQVWRGPIKLGSYTTCTGTVNSMGAPAGYNQYDAVGGKMEFAFNAGGGTDPEPTGYTVSGAVTSYNAAAAPQVKLVQGSVEAYEATLDSGTASGAQVTHSFTFSGVVNGTYDLVIIKAAHLTYTLRGVVVRDGNVDLSGRDITMPVGDLNGDGIIDVSDLNIIWNASNYNKQTSMAEDPLTDLNGDGIVDVSDLNTLWNATNYNKSAAAHCTFDY